MAALNLPHEGKANDVVLAHLEDARLLRQLAYINGKWVAGNQDIAVTNPADDQVIGYVTALKKSQVDNAINAAESAFSKWRAFSAEKRAELLMHGTTCCWKTAKIWLV